MLPTILFAAVFFAVPSFGSELVLIDRERLSDITDDSTLASSSDKTGWDYLFRLLNNCSETDITTAKAMQVGFLELYQQPAGYRGRWIQITGKLLRCEFIPESPEESPFDSDDAADETAEKPKQFGFYKSWILLPDRKDIPVCVCSIEIPDGVDTEGNDISLPVSVTGISYKRLLFLSEQDKEVLTPVILAKTLKLLPVPVNKSKKEEQRNRYAEFFNPVFISTLGLIVAVWILIRAGSKKKKKKLPDSVNMSENISDSELGEGKTVVNSSGHTQFMPPVNAKFWFIPIFILFGISGSSSLLYAEDEVLPVGKIDAEFVQTQLLQTDEYIWDALGDAKVPLEQQRDSVLELLDRLRRYVSAGFMKENITASFPNRSGNSAAGIPMPLSVLTSDPAQYRGKVFRLTGTLVGNVEIVPLNPAEQKAMEIPAIYRCRISIGSEDNSKNNIAEVLTAFAPHSLCEPEKKNVDNNTDADNLHLVRKRVAVTGIYIKRLYTDDKEVKDDSPLIPLLVSTRLEWFPDNYLGSLGMDFGTFEQVPVLSITDMKEKNLKNIPFSLSLLSRGELIRRAFKFTAADKEPFYGMLRAAKNTPKGRIEQEARNELQQNPKMQQTKRNLTSAVLLFNKPAEMQGKPVLLTGTAKRVMLTLVEDEEVKKLYGIDRYYQIYLFTEDSQSNPLVVCTTSLPEGMPVGSAPDYAEIISVGAFPYKLWVYETSKKLEEDENQQDSYKRGYAPMLVGRCPVWHSKPKEDAAKKKQFGESLPNEVKSGITVTLFVALLCVWIFLRRVKMYRTDSDPPRFNWRK